MSKFNKYLLLVVAMLLLVFVTACGSKDDSNQASNDSNKSDTTDKSDDGKSDETFVLKYNTAYPPSYWDWDPKFLATEHFAELVEERTDGRVKIEIYFSNQLAGQEESLDALARGTIDIQNTTPTAWSSKIPEGAFSALPFGWMGEEHAAYLLRETDVGKLYEEALEDYGAKVLGYWYSGTSGYMSNKPIKGPEDFNGIVMNITGNLTTDFYQSLGAGVANIAFAEQYEALLRGTIDTILFPYYSLETYKLSEVVDSITVPGPVAPSYGLVAISKATWDKLPEDIQQILMDTAYEMEVAGIEGSKRLTEMGIEYAEQEGLEVVKMSREDYQKFNEISREKVWDKYAAINDRTARMTEVLFESAEKWAEENPEAAEYFDRYLAD